MASKSIYLFTGDEKLIIKNKITYLIQEVNASEHNISTYDLEEIELSNAIQDAQTAPFLSEYKVIILRNPLFLTNEKTAIEHNVDMFMQYLKNPLETTILVIDACGIKISEKKAVTKELKKYADVRNTVSLSDVEMRGWLTRMLSKERITIDESAIQAFFNTVGNNLEIAKHEADKLIHYVGEGNKVTTQIVHSVCTKELEKDVYSLSNYILDEEKEKAIQRYHRLVKDGNDSFYLLSLISKAVREIYIGKLMLEANYNQDAVSKVLGVSPGKAYYVLKNAKKMNLSKIEKFIHHIGELDYKIKSGQVDIQTGLELFLFEI